MKGVLVTGADCFIGSHLTELSQYNSFNHWGWLDDVDCLPDIEVLNADVRDSHCRRYITKDADAVFHLAVLIAMPYSYGLPKATKLRGLTGFRPAYGIREGLQSTIDWFTRPANLAKHKANIYNV